MQIKSKKSTYICFLNHLDEEQKQKLNNSNKKASILFLGASHLQIYIQQQINYSKI